MSVGDPRIEAFFSEAKRWREELCLLRSLLRDSPLSEEFKWRSPCYTFEGSNVATVWGFKECCALSFFKGVLLQDPQTILVAPGENSRSVRMVRFTDASEITSRQDTLRSYIHEAVAVERSGLTVDFRTDTIAPTDELLAEFGENPDLEAAFEALTPGRQRGYVIYFSQPKQSKTRLGRIRKSIPRILDGKGLHDR